MSPFGLLACMELKMILYAEFSLVVHNVMGIRYYFLLGRVRRDIATGRPPYSSNEVVRKMMGSESNLHVSVGRVWRGFDVLPECLYSVSA
jgi:hypothetical protein